MKKGRMWTKGRVYQKRTAMRCKNQILNANRTAMMEVVLNPGRIEKRKVDYGGRRVAGKK